MKRLLCSLTWGLVSILLVMGTSVSSARADDKKSPLRGHWSGSQVSEINPAFGGATTTAIATFTVDNSGGLTGHGAINSACTAAGPGCPAPNPLELDFSGTLTANEDGTAAMTLVLPAFGITVDRACVLMQKQGDCFQEFRCINTSPNGEVVLGEFKRLLAGTCK
jgi:hypothetical protein